MADKKTPEELAHGSFADRVYALGDKLIRPLIVLFTFSLVILSVANQLFPEPPPKAEVPVERIEQARKYASESKRLFDELVPGIDLRMLSAESKQRLADLAGAIAGTEDAVKSMVPPPQKKNWLQELFSFGPITEAYAQDSKDATAVAVSWMRQGIVVFMIVCITILLIGFLILYFKTSDPEKLKFADSMIRMIVGFYIGVVTGLLGIPPV
ncbi:hypothetical protein IB270_25110 [Ensifer sp. ENS05]|uniref:hypothetical protein n=1 Tax=Ensifer sp. ENS05 TaxID=2769277 RepID=UPI001781D982|nr:hypothetical protein [Ensifer sp. ENS05]MBD9596124.1 hypothetical protein [Ensifer sp. ENS05]